MKNPIQQLKLLPLILLLSGCATMSGQPANEWTADRHYNEARQAQAAANYEIAIQHLNKLEADFPQSPHAQLAPLELAFAHYKSKQFDTAITAVDQFIEEQPEHANIAYAHYLKGMIYFDQTAVDSAANQADFNVEPARMAYQEFSTLTKSFPDSQYHSDAQKRMTYLRGKMAHSELEQAKQDMLAGNLAIAKGRAKYISENYAGTAAANEAKSLLAEVSPVTVIPVLADAVQKEEVMNKTSTNEAWLLRQNPAHYTVQIAATSKKKMLKAFIENNDLQDNVTFYRRERQGKDWYSVLYGDFANYEEANTMAQQLTSKLGLDGTWVRSFQHVQTSIEASDP